jgi:integrase
MSKQQNRVKLTAGRVDAFTCPAGKSQVFLWDTDTPTLALRVTPTGRKTYVFESRLNGSTLRVNIGTAADWPIKKAQGEAQRLKMLVDSGQDPREIERQQQADKEAEHQRQQQEATRQTVTGLHAWAEYVEEGRSLGFTNRGPWGVRHAADHDTLAAGGGVAYKRKSEGTTQPGPLYALLALPLVQIDAPAVAEWLKHENATRPARAALGFRLLRGFLNWCSEQSAYGAIAKTEAHKPKDVRRLVRKQEPKTDALQREHLPAWFEQVQACTNTHARAYLVGLLVTGARANELAGLRWADVELRFGGSLAINDKVEGMRVIPCPAYLANMLAALPRRGSWVFGTGEERPKLDDDAAYYHRKALAAGGLPHVSLHGLRRSFKGLSEWVECPAGIVAQIMGHKPSATAEKHYTARSVDLLRMWHNKIEAWMLAQAGVKFDRTTEPGKLRAVAA